MTVIAWDGAVLAADRRAVSVGLCRPVTKIERHGDCLLAITGNFDIAVEMREWFKSGAEPSKFPESGRKDEATLIVVRRDGVLTYCSGPYPMKIESEKCAFGSGRDYAEAAMFLGHSAVVAVEVACNLDNGCGNGINVLHLEAES